LNKNEKLVAGLTADSDGGTLAIFNQDEKAVGFLASGPDGGRLQLSTPGGEVRFKAP
jgi:hypothetical protein